MSLIGIAVAAVRHRSLPHDKGQNSTTPLSTYEIRCSLFVSDKDRSMHSLACGWIGTKSSAAAFLSISRLFPPLSVIKRRGTNRESSPSSCLFSPCCPLWPFLVQYCYAFQLGRFNLLWACCTYMRVYHPLADSPLQTPQVPARSSSRPHFSVLDSIGIAH